METKELRFPLLNGKTASIDDMCKCMDSMIDKLAAQSGKFFFASDQKEEIKNSAHSHILSQVSLWELDDFKSTKSLSLEELCISLIKNAIECNIEKTVTEKTGRDFFDLNMTFLPDAINAACNTLLFDTPAFPNMKPVYLCQTIKPLNDFSDFDVTVHGAFKNLDDARRCLAGKKEHFSKSGQVYCNTEDCMCDSKKAIYIDKVYALSKDGNYPDSVFVIQQVNCCSVLDDEVFPAMVFFDNDEMEKYKQCMYRQGGSDEHRMYTNDYTIYSYVSFKEIEMELH